MNGLKINTPHCSVRLCARAGKDSSPKRQVDVRECEIMRTLQFAGDQTHWPESKTDELKEAADWKISRLKSDGFNSTVNSSEVLRRVQSLPATFHSDLLRDLLAAIELSASNVGDRNNAAQTGDTCVLHTVRTRLSLFGAPNYTFIIRRPETRLAGMSPRFLSYET